MPSGEARLVFAIHAILSPRLASLGNRVFVDDLPSSDIEKGCPRGGREHGLADGILLCGKVDLPSDDRVEAEAPGDSKHEVPIQRTISINGPLAGSIELGTIHHLVETALSEYRSEFFSLQPCPVRVPFHRQDHQSLDPLHIHRGRLEHREFRGRDAAGERHRHNANHPASQMTSQTKGANPRTGAGPSGRARFSRGSSSMRNSGECRET